MCLNASSKKSHLFARFKVFSFDCNLVNRKVCIVSRNLFIIFRFLLLISLLLLPHTRLICWINQSELRKPLIWTHNCNKEIEINVNLYLSCKLLGIITIKYIGNVLQLHIELIGQCLVSWFFNREVNINELCGNFVYFHKQFTSQRIQFLTFKFYRKSSFGFSIYLPSR